jgi:hypothetical protein
MLQETAPRLDPSEQHYWIAGPRAGLRLFLRRLSPAPSTAGCARPVLPVLYVHGATFPSGFSIAHRFDGCSWRDALCAAGFDVWGLDFQGFGHSDRYPEMEEVPDAHAALCRTEDASAQLETAVRFIRHETSARSLSIIAHSSSPIHGVRCRPASSPGATPPKWIVSSCLDRLPDVRPGATRRRRVYRPGGWSHMKSSGRASWKMFLRKRRRCSHAHTSPPGESTIWIAIPIAEPGFRPA